VIVHCILVLVNYVLARAHRRRPDGTLPASSSRLLLALNNDIQLELDGLKLDSKGALVGMCLAPAASPPPRSSAVVEIPVPIPYV
jgi:hypothetical protein